jgi:predicted O-methyltransferase YrrM
MDNLIGQIGQINLNEQLGKTIYELVCSNKYNNIVEIGTWNGLGSTYCILKALEDSKNNSTIFYTVEMYTEIYHAARTNLAKYINYPNFKMLNGRIINAEEAYWFDHKELDFNSDTPSSKHAMQWYQRDMDLLIESPNVIDELPNIIDLLILDGGEYTTYPEWLKLKDRAKYVILDDTKMLKCSKIRSEILRDSRYSIIKDATDDRNGYLICEKSKNMFKTPNEIQYVDESCGLILPWYTKPCLDYLLTLNYKNWEIFEWGGGCSTVWYASKCIHVDTLENDSAWANEIIQYLNNNKIINYSMHTIDVPPSANTDHPNKLDYLQYISSLNKNWDCIIIDGSYRNEALAISMSYIKPGGLIIFDNYRQDTSGCPDLPNEDLVSAKYAITVYTQPDRPYWKTAIWQA